MNYYEHHIGDFDADTAHLSWLEDMAYTRLMRLYYRKEKAIPCDVGDACRLVRAISKEQRQAVESVLREFFCLLDDGWHQKRCDADVARFQAKAERNREVGKLGGRPRKLETQKEPSGLFVGLQIEPKRNPPQSPVSRHQTPEEKETPPTPKGAGRFGEFWSAWPKSNRKGGRPECLKVWEAKGFDCQAEFIVAHVSAMAKTPDWQKESGQYIPAPVVYLRGQKWDGAEVGAVETYAGAI